MSGHAETTAHKCDRYHFQADMWLNARTRRAYAAEDGRLLGIVRDPVVWRMSYRRHDRTFDARNTARRRGAGA